MKSAETWQRDPQAVELIGELRARLDRVGALADRLSQAASSEIELEMPALQSALADIEALYAQLIAEPPTAVGSGRRGLPLTGSIERWRRLSRES